MSVTQLEPAEKGDAVALLRAFIAEGGYGEGDRLPAERELIVSLGISRATLRKALDALEREGAIWRHVGRGTFVAGPGEGGIGVLGGIAQQITPIRMVRARLCIEPAIAREAAINASRDAVIALRLAKDRAVAAPNWEEYGTQDGLFHRAVADATDNALLIHLFEQLDQVRRAVALSTVVRDTVRPPREHSSFLEHERIAAAIAARDPNAAYDAMRQHINSVSARLFGEV
ncbi:FadR/GntR family transcriptional regulator [Oceaniglobus roseus]|uniref:FadR/GntR family transcriptional regulator n=1 Tax=Oceaniglobus roseus TaxID=1737570 RepID=UPI000C7EC439|nr:FCD domain-containing protein [Kandeliimicrobium roseum]